jgi:hypothetical protein
MPMLSPRCSRSVAAPLDNFYYVLPRLFSTYYPTMTIHLLTPSIGIRPKAASLPLILLVLLTEINTNLCIPSSPRAVADRLGPDRGPSAGLQNGPCCAASNILISDPPFREGCSPEPRRQNDPDHDSRALYMVPLSLTSLRSTDNTRF